MNDEGALGRKVVDVPDPADKNNVLDREELEANPYPVDSLTEDGFRPVVASAGDNVSIAIGQDGVVKAWGSFHVRIMLISVISNVSDPGPQSPRLV